jgi:hypothetical protein
VVKHIIDELNIEHQGSENAETFSPAGNEE